MQVIQNLTKEERTLAGLRRLLFTVELIGAGQGLDADYCVGSACPATPSADPLSLEVSQLVSETIAVIKVAAEQVVNTVEVNGLNSYEPHTPSLLAVALKSIWLGPWKELLLQGKRKRAGGDGSEPYFGELETISPDAKDE